MKENQNIEFLGTYRGEKMYGNSATAQCLEYKENEVRHLVKENTRLEMDLIKSRRKTFFESLIATLKT